MASGKNKLEDFDEDVDDVSWSDIEDDFDADEFDDSTVDSGEGVPGAESPEKGGKASRKAKKKGSSGVMMLGIGAVCLAVGGYYFYETSLSSSAKKGLPSTTLAGATPEDTAMAGTLPVSGQVEAAIEAAPADSGEISLSVAQDNIPETGVLPAQNNVPPEVLTPMPEVQELGEIELSSLDVEDTGGLPVDASGNGMDDALPLDEDQLAAMDSLSGRTEETGNPGLEEEKLLTETEKPFWDAERTAKAAREEATAQEALDGGSPDVRTIEEELRSLPEDLEEKAPEALAEPVDAVREELQSAPDSGLSDLEGTDHVTEAAEIEDSASPVAAPPPVEERTQAEAVSPVSAPSEPTPAVSAPSSEQPVKKPEAASLPAPVWKLRSAQPGRAVIYEARRDEMKTVEIGDTVSGIGKILSISNASGKWVVQGTTGRVVQ